MIVRHSNKFHSRSQIVFITHLKGDVAGARGPTMQACFACGENARLILFRQPNVAMAKPVDVHEHRSSEKEGVLVDSRILLFGHSIEPENSAPQLLMKVSSLFLGRFKQIHDALVFLGVSL